ncbi:MAG: hypothetical protein U0939_11830 [Pirellulales bacterium]
MLDPIAWLWSFAEARDPVFEAMSMYVMIGDDFDRLVALNIVVRTANAECVSCPACGQHGEEVIAFDYPDGVTRYYVPCPLDFRVEVHPKLLERWTIHWDALAQATASGLALRGMCTPLIASRLWRLGRLKWQGATRDVLLARGLAWPDGDAIARQIAHATRPIAFVGDAVPPTDAWAGRAPPIVRLSQVTSLDHDGPQIDGEAVLSAIIFADDANLPAKQCDLNSENLERIIRRQIKAEAKSQLTDDVIVAAYKQEGSIRKAAKFLSESTGQSITKDRVQSALERCGGVSQMASPRIKRAYKLQ